MFTQHYLPPPLPFAHYPRPSVALLPPQPPFAVPLLPPVRHRKQISIGGPPKAVLGGPQRKVTPLPAPPKPKKVPVNLPRESLPDGQRQDWARYPIRNPDVLDPPVPPLGATTRDIFPLDIWRRLIPDTIDVFLPGQHAWDSLKQQVIEEKLEQLGVERGSGSNLPHIYAPHARAASISSPADPALLMFKLNKLQQQQQDALLSPSLPSPQPPFNSSPRFLTHPPMVPPRHGHTMSLSQPPSYPPLPLDVGAYHTALSPAPRPTLSIPQPHSNLGQLSSPNPMTPALSAVQQRNRPDFIRGFGLEAPEEADEDAEEEKKDQPLVDAQEDTADDTLDAATATVTSLQSRVHSRHGSKFSASLSVPSRIRTPPVADVTADLDVDAAGEWTVSDELYPSESSDNESIGEWSNPSDEERARQGRAERRMRRRLAWQQLANKPQRILNFPKPPEEPSLNIMAHHQHRLSNPQPQQSSTYDRDEDIVSNPSEEYLAAAAGSIYAPHSPNSRPLPLPPKHSRTRSASQCSAHDPAQAHSRNPSDTFGVQYQQQIQQRQEHQIQPLTPTSALNPYAKPFVFGPVRPSQPVISQQQQQQLAAPPNAPLLSHSPLPSVGSSVGARASISSLNSLNAKPLNVSAPEFKPGFTFRPPPGVPQMPTLQIPTGLGLGLGLGPTADGGWGIGGSVSPGGLFSRPLPPIPLHAPGKASQESREHQSREEKRLRRNSSSGDVGNVAVFDEVDSLRSFRFPVNVESPKSLRSMRRSMSDASVHHRIMSSSDREKERNDQEPFSYAAFSTVASMPFMPLPKENDSGEDEKDMEVEEDAIVRVNGEESTFADDSTAKNETRLSAEDKENEGEGTSLFRSKRRPPLPLDFRQEVTRKNTVPAGLFKALANGNNRDADERTRKAVRSRLSSRDFFDDCRKPSLDDTNMPRISNSLGRGRFIADIRGGLFGRVGDDADGEESDEDEDKKSLDDDDVFSTTRQQQQHKRRSSSLPDDLHDVEEDDADRELAESPGLELTTREDMQDFEERLVDLIEDRFGAIERVLCERRDGEDTLESPAVLSSGTEAMIADMVSLFRAQLQENAARSLEDSQMDARGEMDFQLIKDIIDEGHKELAEMLRKELKSTPEQQTPQMQQIKDIVARVAEDVGSRTVGAIVETIADFSARQEAAVNRVASSPTRERDALVEKLVNTLTPMLAQARTQPIDYEFLTTQLAQAVKPHISQLIDLASDKRETAGLIVEQILPLLPGQPMDVDALMLKLITEVRRAIAPIDTHEIKEQVADLVIERLDSRLAVRDKMFNVDAMVMEGVSDVVIQGPVAAMHGVLSKAMEEQKKEWQAQIEELSLRITELPAKLVEKVDGLVDVQDKIMSKLEQPVAKAEVDESVKTIVAHVEQLVIGGQKDLHNRDEELLSLNKEILDKLLSLPDALLAASNVLSDTHSELVASLESSRCEVDELRKLNTEYQVQMAKARGAHGQVRVEKDALNEKLMSTETDRERLRAQVNELQSEKAVHTTEINALKIRNVELEEALAQALARLQTADVSTAASQQRLADLEQASHDLSDEKYALQATVESLNMQLKYANRDKETMTQGLERLQKQNDNLTLQQSHWDSLREAAEKIDGLTSLIGQADNEELKELRQMRNHTKVLETEHTTLQKRIKEAENKVANSERAATTARQSLAQAQQRAAEWERRTKEAEGQLELMQTKLEQAELTQTQMEADLSLFKLQLEEREAEDRLTKDREAKYREQITVLETKMSRIQTELEQAKTHKLPQAMVSAVAPSPFRVTTNGIAPRPDSRASTVYNMRSPTPSQHPRSVSQASFNSGTPPSGSVWNSMHAPTRQPYPTPGWSSYKYPYLGPSTPRGQQNAHHHVYRSAAPSPTPSTASAAPTQGEDGWWS